MRPTTHAVAGYGMGLFLYIFVPSFSIVTSVIFILTSVFIDVDHIPYYFYYARCESSNAVHIIKRTYEFCIDPDAEFETRQKNILYLLVLHTLEFLLLVKLLDVFIGNAFASAILMGIFWGCVFHMLLDLIYMVKNEEFDRTFLLVEYFIRKRLRK